MSVSRLSAARRIWRARRERIGGDTAYALYASLLVAATVIAPVVRALWVAASSPSGLAALASADASAAVSTGVAALWAGALLVGAKRGPALLPPFPLHALASSGIRRSLALRRPMLRSAAAVAAACALGAVLLGAVRSAHGQAGLWCTAPFIAASVAVGVVTVVLWLIGQVFPRAAGPLAPALLALAAASLSAPHSLAFAPWARAGAAYPPSGSAVLPSAAVIVLAAASVITTPALLDRLTGMQLAAQAARWERAAAFSFSFDLRAAASVYASPPRIGRRLRAVAPSRRRWVTFFVRDLVGQVRTPGRSSGAVLVAAAAGAMTALSFLPQAPAALLAGAAGIATFWATGPLTTGLQHAAAVAGDHPLYGIGDRRLVLLHALFPLTALLAVLPGAAAVAALVVGAPPGIPVAGACTIGVLALALRVGSALKGPLPPSLLAPVSTPVGDLGIVVRLGWAFGEPLIAVLGALAVTALPATPILLALPALSATALLLVRWRRRR